MNTPFAAVCSMLDDSLTDDRLTRKYCEMKTEAGSSSARAVFTEWYKNHPGYEQRFPLTYKLIQHDLKMYEEQWQSLYDAIRSTQI